MWWSIGDDVLTTTPSTFELMWAESNQSKGLALPSVPDRTPVWTHTHTMSDLNHSCVSALRVCVTVVTAERPCRQQNRRRLGHKCSLLRPFAKQHEWINELFKLLSKDTLSTFRVLHPQAFTFDKTRGQLTFTEHIILWVSAGGYFETWRRHMINRPSTLWSHPVSHLQTSLSKAEALLWHWVQTWNFVSNCLKFIVKDHCC